MKFVHITTAAAAALTLAGTASAQSTNLAFSGVADLAARSVSNQGLGAAKSLVSGSNSTSRLILRGTEDLGGGLSAGFHLEHGMLVDDTDSER